MTFGNMGGAVQPETHAQHMVNVIDHGMNVQMTTDAARFTQSEQQYFVAGTRSLQSGGKIARGQRARGAFREWRPGGWLSGDSFHP